MIANTPFSLLGDHDGVNTDAYRYYRDNVQVQEQPVSALADGLIAFAELAGLPAGTYTLKVTSVGAGGATESEVLVLVVTIPPPAPVTNLRIVF